MVDGTADGRRGTFVPCARIHACAGETVAGQVGGAVSVVMADGYETHCGGKELLESPYKELNIPTSAKVNLL